MTGVKDHPSPNFGSRPAGTTIDTLVIHYTATEDTETALGMLTGVNAHGPVSAHYLIGEDGEILRLVSEDKRAWHAGVGYWRGCDNLNDVSIGIELVNPGHDYGYRPFEASQINALVELLRDMQTRHSFSPSRVIGHSDLAPDRKIDPGELFPWHRLADIGLGVLPRTTAQPGPILQAYQSNPDQISALQAQLGALGYAVRPTGLIDERTEAAVRALQMHWRQARVDGQIDQSTLDVLDDLLDQLGPFEPSSAKGS